jgi:nickel/cobalt transporter (NiCoT) family protein
MANLLALLRTPPGQPVGLVGARSHWLPARLAQASHPAVIAAVGAAFAISFDTVSHALVFSAGAGAAFAALLGAVFTVGMASTDALNGWWISRLVSAADRRAAIASRIMSGAIATLCLTIAAYGAARQAAPQLGAPLDAWAPMLGVATCAFLLLVYFAARRAPKPA